MHTVWCHVEWCHEETRTHATMRPSYGTANSRTGRRARNERIIITGYPHQLMPRTRLTRAQLEAMLIGGMVVGVSVKLASLADWA